MKKLYTLSFAALAAAGAMALVPSPAAPFQLKNTKTQLMPADMAAKTVDVNAELAVIPGIDSKMKAPAKLVAMESGLGEFDCTYVDFFDQTGATQSGEATVAYDEEYQVILVSLPDANEITEFEASWDELAGGLMFKQLNFGSYSGYTLYQMPLVKNGTSWSLASSITIPYDPATGTYDFGSDKAIGWAAVSGSSVAGFFSRLEQVKLTRPDGDYKLAVLTSDECHPTNEFAFLVQGGADIAKVRVGLFAGDFAAANNKDVFASSQYSQEIPLNTAMSIKVDATKLAKSTYYSVLAAGYNAAGEVKKYAEGHFVAVRHIEDEWVEIGKMAYNENFVSVYYNHAFANPEVVLLESKAKPGLFRLLNPYSGHEYLHADECVHHVDLDITDPTYVAIPFSVTGVDYQDGIITMGTFHTLGYEKADAAAKNLPMATLSERTITFPIKSVLAHESKYNESGSWSYVNTKSESTITLPDLNLSVKCVDNSGNANANVNVEAAGVSATTDENGVAELKLPASVDYLDKVSVKVTNPASQAETTQEIQLQGTNNQATIAADLSGIANIAADNDAEAEYFTLQGVSINNPVAGSVVLKRQGGKVAKVVVK